MAEPGSGARAAGFPSWLTFVDSVLPVTALFAVHGSIRDLQLTPGADGTPRLCTLPVAVRELLSRSGVASVVYCSPLHGVTLLPGAADSISAEVFVDGLRAGDPSQVTDASLAALAHRVAASPTPVALIIDYMSQFPSAEPTALQRELLRIANDAAGSARSGTARTLGHNPVFLLVDKAADLPAWLLSGDGIRQVPVAEPDIEVRTRAARSLLPVILGTAAVAADEQDRIVTRFVEATHGLSLRALMEIIQLRSDADIPPERIEDAARLYRVGLVADPWRSPALRDRIAAGTDALTRRVKGQPRAVRHAVDILVRSVTGMTSAHRGPATAGVRGVMFLAGPTGVGKTELAKSVAEMLFGDDAACIRFDMSEFAESAADQRLIGAPPGYIGHEAGGQLTNAVRDRPFCVLLFDEIEKAHPRVLDKFLQILSDGRLSDGSGDTVFFSEALVLFTSNLGIGEPGTAAADCAADSSAYARAITDAVRTVFTRDLNRPELLGRIGDNIVVFDYISDDVAGEIADGYVDNVIERVRRSTGVLLTITDGARSRIISAAIADLSMGARGVGNTLETQFVNPLARAVFGVTAGHSRVIQDVVVDTDGIATVVLT